MTCLIADCMICRMHHDSTAFLPVYVPGPPLPTRDPGDPMRRTDRPDYIPSTYHYAGPLGGEHHDQLSAPAEFAAEHRPGQRSRRRPLFAMLVLLFAVIAAVIFAFVRPALADDPDTPPTPFPTDGPTLEPTRPLVSEPPAPPANPPPGDGGNQTLSLGRGPANIEIIWTAA